MGMRAIVTALVLVALGSGVAAASGNAPPVASAGLDQTVTEGTVVYLDGGGSTDEDGQIVEYEWTITTPAGDTTDPDCPTCEQTRFTPTDPGEYEVELQVTDDNGTATTDTLYVTVEEAEGPSVTIDGPADATAGVTETYTISADGDDGAIDEVTLHRGGTAVETWSPNGRSATVVTDQSFDDDDRETLRAVATDTRGNVDVDTMTVSVDEPAEPSVSLTGPDEATDVGEETYTIDAQAGGTPLDSITLYRGGAELNSWDVSGESSRTVTRDVRFDTAGDYEIRTVVEDQYGHTVEQAVDVTVEDVEGPSVWINGPSEPDVGEEARYRALADRGDAEIHNFSVYVDGDLVDSYNYSGWAGSYPVDRWARPTFDREDRTHVVRAVVEDANGVTAEQTMEVDPIQQGPRILSIEGPTEVREGQRNEWSATVESGASGAPLHNITFDWVQQGTDAEMFNWETFDEGQSGDVYRTTASGGHYFFDTGTQEVNVTARDVDGRTTSRTFYVSVLPADADVDTSSSEDSGNSCSGKYVLHGQNEYSCSPEDERQTDLVIDDVIVPNSPEDGIQLANSDGNIATIIDGEETQRLLHDTPGDNSIPRSVVQEYVGDKSGEGLDGAADDVDNPDKIEEIGDAGDSDDSKGGGSGDLGGGNDGSKKGDGNKGGNKGGSDKSGGDKGGSPF